MVEWTIYGCRVRVSCLFFALAAALLTLDRTGSAGFGIAAALMHETGHLIMLLLCRQKPSLICLDAFGVRVEYPAHTRMGYCKSLLVSLSGPAVNLLTAGFLCLAAPGSRGAAVHLAIGCFNLLPVTGLDGGEALRAGLLLRFSPARVRRVLTVTSWTGTALLLAAGAAVWYLTGYNVTLLLLGAYMTFLSLLRRND